MHYYQFNIGDYKSHTSGLSIIEDIAYRRLLDTYYLNERPFNGCSKDVAREIGMREYADEVDYVLSKFFTQKGSGDWENKRAKKEIEKYRNKKILASAAGRASGKARRSKGSERTFDSVQPTINHKPITKKEKKEKKESWRLPKEVNPDIWAEFEQHRKDIRKPLTDQARTKNANILQSLPVDKQRQCVDTTIAQRWTGVFPPKTESKPKRNGSGTAEDVGRAYQAEFGKPPPAGKTTDEVRVMISQKRNTQSQWWDG